MYISKRFQAPTTRPMIKQINIKCHIVYARVRCKKEKRGKQRE